MASHDDRDLNPSFLASIGGYLRPGHDTAREGAAGTSLTTAGLALAVAGIVAYLVTRRRRREH